MSLCLYRAWGSRSLKIDGSAKTTRNVGVKVRQCYQVDGGVGIYLAEENIMCLLSKDSFVGTT